MTTIVCVRCGGPTRVNQFGLGVCKAGTARQACGHWWRRDGGRCSWDWAATEDGPASCPGACGWDHRLFFTPTHTTPGGEEHRYHAPPSAVHRTVAIVRPAGTGRRLAEIGVSPSHPGDVGSACERERDRRLLRLYGYGSLG